MSTVTPQDKIAVPNSAAGPRQQPTVAATYAGFWKRFLAVVIDGIIVSIPANILAGMFGTAAVITTGGFDYRPYDRWLETVLMILYETWLLSNWNGQTIGKRIMGVRVVTLDGQPITPTTALVRSLMKIISGAAILLGYIWMLWDPNKQTWHDKVASTYVVKE